MILPHLLLAVAVDRMPLVMRAAPEPHIFERVLSASGFWDDVVFFEEMLGVASLAGSWIGKRALGLISFPDRSSDFGLRCCCELRLWPQRWGPRRRGFL